MAPSDHDQLSRHLLRELSSLNYRFIRLLADSKDHHDGYGLSASVYRRLCLLDDQDCRRLASCPYSLFELQLDQPAEWDKWLGQPTTEPVSSFAATPSAAHPFTLAVLMYTQQLAVENTDLGRLLLGLAPRVAEKFRQASIGRLIDTAPLVSASLRARLINDPNFWPDLVNYVRDGTQEQYVAAQTSALQLLAAQL